MLAGAACAALMGVAVPTTAATFPYSPVPAQARDGSADRTVTTFYAQRQAAPLWLSKSGDASGARELISVLRRASLDGMPSGPALASQAENLIARANSGDPSALAAADRLLSTAWVLYVQNLQRTPAGMTIADGWAAPRAQPALEILQRAALAPSLASHVRSVSTVNPIYAQLREAAWQQSAGGARDPRILANLARVRAMPFQDRYIMVDAGSAQLWMVENDRIVDSMKVIVGKPSTQTPMLASTIYRATLNPYWNVPQDMVKSLIAPRVIDQGISYLKSHGYQVLSGYGGDAELIDAGKVDWRAVAAGREVVKVRQLPGPGNSMGQVKFSFPNSEDIFLHDTPKKELFASADRDVSNGCIRLEDAQRLGRWLLGREPITMSSSPEQHVLLPKPVPVYVTYLTTGVDGGRLTFLQDSYARDAQSVPLIAAIR